MDLTPIAASLIILAHSITATYMGVDPEKVPPIKGAYTLPINSYLMYANLMYVNHQQPVFIYMQTKKFILEQNHIIKRGLFSHN